MSLGSPDYYLRLNISREASEDEVKVAFRILAKRYHPDLNHGSMTAESAFKSVNEAYAVLSDGSARQAYDQVNRYAGGGGGLGRGFSAAAGAAAAGFRTPPPPPPPRHRSTPSSTSSDAGWEDPSAHVDFDEWRRSHYGTGAGMPPPHTHTWTTESVRNATKNGFSSFNDAQNTPHQNWEARRAAREAAAVWSVRRNGANGIDSDIHSYREWAKGFKASAAAAERSWPRTIAALAIAGALGYTAIFTVMRSPLQSLKGSSSSSGGGGGGGGGAAKG